MVELLLQFKGKLDEVLEKALNRAEAFANSLKEAFENFINQRQNKPAELIAKFIDAKVGTHACCMGGMCVCVCACVCERHQQAQA